MRHIGFTGTRYGMSAAQRIGVEREVDAAIGLGLNVIHHGCCVGSDSDFHAIGRERLLWIVGHPGPDWPMGELCARVLCDEVRDPLTHMKRNAAIVAASKVMIAAPFEDEPQARGGTWKTIGMARRALKRGRLHSLYVVGREGQLLDHGAWK